MGANGFLRTGPLPSAYAQAMNAAINASLVEYTTQSEAAQAWTERDKPAEPVKQDRFGSLDLSPGKPAAEPRIPMLDIEIEP